MSAADQHEILMRELREKYGDPTRDDVIEHLLREVAELRSRVLELENQAQDQRWHAMGDDI
jgi:hypothetical protein